MCSNQIIAQMHNIIDGQLALQVGILRQLIPALLPLSNLPDTAAGILVQRDIEPIDHFQYILPYDTIQNEIPEEAISILSTLSIQESSENTD